MLLNFLSRKIISKNKELYNNYLDETCYLFGNGYSIKYLDFANFQNLNVFTSGYTYLHKDFEQLKIVGDFHLHPGIFSPIWKHPYTKKKNTSPSPLAGVRPYIWEDKHVGGWEACLQDEY